MDLFADIIGDEATPEDYNSIAVYFESERNSLQAGRFFHKAGHHSKALRHLLKSAASSNDEGVGKTKLNFKYVMENEGEKQNVIMQLTPKEFYKLLHELDRAKGNLQSLTAGSAASS